MKQPLKRLQVLKARDTVLRLLARRQWLRGVHHVIDDLHVFCWPIPVGAPTHVEVDIMGDNGKVIDSMRLDGPAPTPLLNLPPLPVGQDIGGGWFELSSPAREVTSLVPLRTINRQPGRLVYRICSTACGRARFAPRNSRHQVQACTICTKAARARARALQQYAARRA